MDVFTWNIDLLGWCFDPEMVFWLSGGTEELVPERSCKYCKCTQSRTFPAQFLLCQGGQRLEGNICLVFLFLLRSGCSFPL